ncbi:MAG: flavin reductase [Roseovarius sp.]|nr:flavin reductase [Roseovarius sp.]
MIDARTYRDVLGHYPTGVCAISAFVAGSPLAMVVGTFTSVSLEPPLIGFLPARSSETWQQLRHADVFCVNVLASDQAALCKRMATRGPDRFADVDWIKGSESELRIGGALAWILCHLASVTEAGDHDFVLGHVCATALVRDTAPLIFHRGGFTEPTSSVGKR